MTRALRTSCMPDKKSPADRLRKSGVNPDKMSEYRFLPLRTVRPGGDSGDRYDRWLARLDEELSDPGTDRNEFCRRVLEEIYFPGGLNAGLGTDGRATLPLTTRILLDQLDPRNVTLEPEYYRETDLERYYRVKPLIWLWEMFDKSVLGENVHLGVKFRRILARRIFARCGRNFKAFHFVKLSFGYGLEVGDDVVVHRHVLLDDRGGIRIGNRASISDFVNVYSHSHHIRDARDVRTPRTVIGNGVRIAYHATVLAGTTLAPDSMVGAGALVTRDTEPGTVHVGVPARPATRKPEGERRPPTRDPLAEE
ncbi:MAG: acyltransferase [Gemmatimonadetes bacterium]|nr:acyltransferase [Gemmatimonadota bacterium]MYB99156.1 acyltransferase [Gemmatimonadota bacterium]MYI47021.1 acyltransferase [Gemmatimonadota bacterium]